MGWCVGCYRGGGVGGVVSYWWEDEFRLEENILYGS